MQGSVLTSSFLLTEGRKMTDINRRLQYNSTHQKQAKQAAEFLELDRQGKEIEEKGQVTDLGGNLFCYEQKRTASLLLETPWERTEAVAR